MAPPQERTAERGKTAERSGTADRHGAARAGGPAWELRRADRPAAADKAPAAPDTQSGETAEIEEPDATDPLALLMSVVMAPQPPVQEPAGKQDAESTSEPALEEKAAAALVVTAEVKTRGSAREPAQPGRAEAPRSGNVPQPTQNATPSAPSTGMAAEFHTDAASEGGDAATAAPAVVPQARGEQARGETGEPVARRTAAGASAGAPQEQKVTVTSVQVQPAPSAPVATPSVTATAFVASLEADGTLASYASDPAAAALPGADAKPVTTLKLQLHPAELGNVTVRISGTGEEIAIEIQVENAEARHRLSSDSDTIVKSLRGLGYDVDRITVQQVAPSANAGQQQGATGGRDGGFSAYDQRGGERGQGQHSEANSGGRGDGRNGQNAQGQSERGGAAASGGVYI